MKKTVLILFAILGTIVIGFTIQSCSSEDDDIYANMNINFDKIGSDHNKGLDYIFEELKKEQKIQFGNVNTKMSNISLNNTIENISVLFVLKSDYGNTIKKEDLHQIFSLLKTNSLTRSNDGNINIEDFDYLLTTKQQYYLNRFKEILASLKVKGSIESVQEDLKTLDKEIISDCTSEEAIPLLAATSVGRNSLDYWNENLYKWAILIENEIEPIAFAPRLKNRSFEVDTNDEEWEWFKGALAEMGQSDGVGAAIGGGLGSLAGGVGAIPGAITVGCNASAGAGIKALLKRWGVF